MILLASLKVLTHNKSLPHGCLALLAVFGWRLFIDHLGRVLCGRLTQCRCTCSGFAEYRCTSLLRLALGFGYRLRALGRSCLCGWGWFVCLWNEIRGKTWASILFLWVAISQANIRQMWWTAVVLYRSNRWSTGNGNWGATIHLDISLSLSVSPLICLPLVTDCIS